MAAQDEVKPEKVKKEVTSKDVDIHNGIIIFHTKGYTDGDILKVSVNGVKSEVKIHNNHGGYAQGGAFAGYPGITIE